MSAGVSPGGGVVPEPLIVPRCTREDALVEQGRAAGLGRGIPGSGTAVCGERLISWENRVECLNSSGHL